MGKPGNTGIRRILRATQFSLQGFAYAIRNESAFRQELALGLILAPLAFWLGRSPAEVAALIVPLLIVLIVELLNSAVEATIDRISDEHHELAGRAKDMGSAAVFVSLVLVLVVWGTVACQRFWA